MGIAVAVLIFFFGKFVTHGVVLSSIIVRGLITEKGDGDGR